MDCTRDLHTIEMQFARLPDALIPWYRKHARDLPWRRDTQPYHVWISEIMLQQTRAETVCGYYLRFLKALPTVQALAEADEDKLLKLWEGLGYYNRARNLQKAAQQIVSAHGGVFPDQYNEILALPGIGPYTAGAVASICFNRPTAAVDGNVLRIITRITENFSPIDLPKTKQEIASALEKVYPAGACGMFTQALMELGATICTPKSPKCASCPAEEFCFARQNDTVSKLPVQLPKRKKRVEEKTVFLLRCGNEIALTKRGANGLLSGLWQFPNTDGALTPEQALTAASQFGARPSELCRQTHKIHIFTHIRWEMTAYSILCTEKPDIFTWATPEEVREHYSLPTAFRMFLDDFE